MLEVLRGRIERFAHLFESVALERSRISGEGTIHLQVRNGQLGMISREIFAQELDIPANSMRRLPMITDDPDQKKNGARITFPEKELREALGIPAALGAER